MVTQELESVVSKIVAIDSLRGHISVFFSVITETTQRESNCENLSMQIEFVYLLFLPTLVIEFYKADPPETGLQYIRPLSKGKTGPPIDGV